MNQIILPKLLTKLRPVRGSVNFKREVPANTALKTQLSLFTLLAGPLRCLFLAALHGGDMMSPL